MTLPLGILAILSAVGGLIGLPEILGAGNWLANFMHPLFDLSRLKNPEAFNTIALSHSTEITLMLISGAVALVAALAAGLLYVNRKAVPAEEGQPIPALQKLVYNKYYIDEIYEALFVKPVNALSNIFYSIFEVLGIDMLVNGVGKSVTGMGKLMRYAQNGAIGFYIFAMVLGIILILLLNLPLIN
jgi:NADH-quinone oxidoreductase subunit L